MQDNQKENVLIINLFIEKYKEYLTDMDRYNTQLTANIAEISALTKELSAKRELINAYFSNHLKEKEQLYSVANKVLDRAITAGNIKMAELALEQIKVIKSVQ